jgi:hypothetical protein
MYKKSKTNQKKVPLKKSIRKVVKKSTSKKVVRKNSVKKSTRKPTSKKVINKKNTVKKSIRKKTTKKVVNKKNTVKKSIGKKTTNKLSNLKFAMKKPFPNLDKKIDKDTPPDDPSMILDLVMFIGQSFEDHFTGATFDITGNYVWAANYLQWATSKKFKEVWMLLWPNFKDTTHEYALLLFEYAEKGPINTAEDLSKRAKEFVNDPKVIAVYKKVSSEN